MHLPRWFALVFLLLLARAALAGPAVPRVEAVRLQLFETKTGRFGEALAASPPRGLANIGSGPQASNAVLVVVEVRGEPDTLYSGRRDAAPRYALRLVASERGRARPLLEQTQPLPAMNTEGQAFLAFLLHPGGCASLRLNVSLVGRHAAKPTELQLPLACGE